MTKPTPKQTWVTAAIAALTLLSGYLGVDKYQASQIIVEAPDIKVEVTSLPAHSHAPSRSPEDLEAIITKAIEVRMHKHITAEGRH